MRIGIYRKKFAIFGPKQGQNRTNRENVFFSPFWARPKGRHKQTKTRRQGSRFSQFCPLAPALGGFVARKPPVPAKLPKFNISVAIVT
jgi:hypothetical protein